MKPSKKANKRLTIDGIFFGRKMIAWVIFLKNENLLKNHDQEEIIYNLLLAGF